LKKPYIWLFVFVLNIFLFLIAHSVLSVLGSIPDGSPLKHPTIVLLISVFFSSTVSGSVGVGFLRLFDSLFKTAKNQPTISNGQQTGSENRLIRPYARFNEDPLLTPILKAACTIVSPLVPLRSCLFCIVPNHDHLAICAYNGSFSPAELQLGYIKLQGVVGKVWHRGKPILVDLLQASEEYLIDEWGLTPGHISATKHLGSIVAVPVMADDESGRIIGVLSVDSIQDLSNTRFDDPKVLLQLSTLAHIAAKSTYFRVDIKVN
jgi:putative methionine-R-sulfoxide reductase with GAF domain